MTTTETFLTGNSALTALMYAKTVQRNRENNGTPEEIAQAQVKTAEAKKNFDAVLARQTSRTSTAVDHTVPLSDNDEDMTPYGYDAVADAEWLTSRHM